MSVPPTRDRRRLRCLRDRLSDDEIVEIAPTLGIIKDAQLPPWRRWRVDDRRAGIPAVNCSTALTADDELLTDVGGKHHESTPEQSGVQHGRVHGNIDGFDVPFEYLSRPAARRSIIKLFAVDCPTVPHRVDTKNI